MRIGGRIRLLAACMPLLLAAAAPAGRSALGQFGRWGAFRDEAPRRCFAIARPLSAGRDDRAVLMVASWPGRAHGQVSLWLDRGAIGPLAIEVAGLRLPLLVRGGAAWAADPRADARLVRLMRGGGLLAVRGTDARGRRFVARYPLEGAGSAIDAMRLGCL